VLRSSEQTTVCKVYSLDTGCPLFVLFTIRKSTRATLLIVSDFVGYWPVILFIGKYLWKPASIVYALCRDIFMEHKNLYGYYSSLIQWVGQLHSVCCMCASNDWAYLLLVHVSMIHVYLLFVHVTDWIYIFAVCAHFTIYYVWLLVHVSWLSTFAAGARFYDSCTFVIGAR